MTSRGMDKGVAVAVLRSIARMESVVFILMILGLGNDSRLLRRNDSARGGEVLKESSATLYTYI